MRAVLLAGLLGAAGSACADRISELPPPEYCAYKARLYEAAYHHFLLGRQLGEVRIHWHGDETAHERRVVTQLLDEAWGVLQAIRASGPARMPSVDTVADDAFKVCMENGERP